MNSVKVTADATNNGGAIVLREKQIAALSDDPDILSQQLQAMAGPGAGPNGGGPRGGGPTGGMMAGAPPPGMMGGRLGSSSRNYT